MTPPIPRFAIGQLVWALQGTEVTGPFPVLSVSLYASQHEWRENYTVRGESLVDVAFRAPNLFPSRAQAEEALHELQWGRVVADAEGAAARRC